MATEISILKVRRDTKSNWLSANPILSDGEFGIETDTQRFKMGNGLAVYSALPYGRNTGEYLNNYNVTALFPLPSGQYYTHESAILAVPVSEKAKGTVVSYEKSNKVWVAERFIGTDLSTWGVASDWEQCATMTDVDAVELKLDNLIDGSTSLISEIDNDIRNGFEAARKKVVDFITDIPTTRLQVPLENRLHNFMLGYNDVNEVYIGNDFTNTEWVKDSNWKTIQYGEAGYSLVSDTEIAKLNSYPIIPTNDDTYLRGDGTFAPIATGSGGYASNVYLSNVASDIANYKTLSYVNDVATTTMSGTSINNNAVLIEEFAYPLPLGVSVLDAGSWKFVLNGKVSNTGAETYARIEIYKRSISNVETLLFTVDSPELNNTIDDNIVFETIQPVYNVISTDRLVVKLYVTTTSNSSKTLTINIGGSKASYVNTPIALRHTQLRSPNEDANVQHMTALEKSALGAIKTKTVTFTTDVATTRKLVTLSERVNGYKLTYSNKTEQYIGSTFTDTEWVKDSNWKTLATLSDIESIKGGSPKTILDIDKQYDNIRNAAFKDVLSLNIFDKNSMIYNAYILSTPNNAGIRGNSLWRMAIIPVVPNTKYTISGWMSSRTELAFYSSKPNSSMFPLDGGYTDGIILSGSSNNIAMGNKIDGKLTITTPNLSTYMAITIRNLSELDSVYLYLQVELGETASEYKEYSEAILEIDEDKIPHSYIDFKVNLSKLGTSYIECNIGGKILKQEIVPFRETPYPFDVRNVYYDNILISTRTDESAPFRIDATTIGGNHASLSYNKNREFKMYIDGEEIFDFNKIYYPKNNFSVVEHYDIKGNTTTDLIAKASLTYVFDKLGNTVIYSDIYSLKTVALQDIMFVMSNPLTLPYSLYIPRTKNVLYHDINYDFSSPYDMSTFSPPARLSIDTRFVDGSDKIPDRIISLKNNIGFAMGYIDARDSSMVKRKLNCNRKYLEIDNVTKKMYPSCIDSSLITSLNQGDYYSSISYKSFFKKDTASTSNYTIETADSFYLYLDFHDSGIKRISVPPILSGLDFTVVDTLSSNVISTINGYILVDVTFTTNNYGFIVIKFKK